MITLRQHIDIMAHIQKGGDIKTFIDGLPPMDKLVFIRDSEDTYPINDKIRQPKTDKKVYTRISDLVLGQFIMLEQIITGKTKLPDHLVDLEIAKLVIRPANHDVFDNENQQEEAKNQEDILNMSVLEVYWILERFMENRNQTLFKDFSGVFYDPMEEEDEEDDISEDKSSEMVFGQQWYWYSIVRMLSGENIHKYAETYMLPMSVVLPEMSYLAQRSKIEAAEKRKSAAMRKL